MSVVAEERWEAYVADASETCAESLKAEGERMRAALPTRIALCPQCAPEFYYPLKDGEGLMCPTMGCGMAMVVYERKS